MQIIENYSCDDAYATEKHAVLFFFPLVNAPPLVPDTLARLAVWPQKNGDCIVQ